MAKEKQPTEPEVPLLEAELVHVGPQLSERTREEMELGRRQAATNAATFAAAEKARAEQK